MYITCKSCGARGWVPVENGKPIPELDGCKRCLERFDNLKKEIIELKAKLNGSSKKKKQEVICIYCGAQVEKGIRCSECEHLMMGYRSIGYSRLSEFEDWEYLL